jgi:hypothetical protein
LIPPGPNPFGGGEYVAGEQPGEGPDANNPYGAQGFSSNYQDNQGQVYEAAEDEPEEDRMRRLMELWDSEIGDLVDEMLVAASANGNGHSA